MRRVMPFLGVICAAFFLISCGREAILIEKIDAGQQGFTGISYFLPKGIVDLTIKTDFKVKNDGGVIDATKTVQLLIDNVRYVPDPEFHYQVNVLHDPFYNDDIHVSVDGSLLLKSVNSIMKDETPDIIKKLAQAPVEILRGDLAEIQRADKFDIKFSLDPTSVKDRARLAEHLSQLGVDIKFSAKPVVSTSAMTSGIHPDCGKHICFRTAMPYALELYTDANNEYHVVSRQVVVLPNKHVVGQIPITRAPFVKKEFLLTFASGMLTSAQLKNPSEVLEFIQIPIAVAKSIVSIPSAMLQFQTTQITADNNLLAAQQKNLDLQKQIIDTQQKVLAAQASQVAAAGP